MARVNTIPTGISTLGMFVTIGFHGVLAKKDVNGGACEDSCWFHGTPPRAVKSWDQRLCRGAAHPRSTPRCVKLSAMALDPATSAAGDGR